MRPVHKRVVNISATMRPFMRCSDKHVFLEFLHEKIGYYRAQWIAHGNSVLLLVGRSIPLMLGGVLSGLPLNPVAAVAAGPMCL